jgi:hypothetical protein
MLFARPLYIFSRYFTNELGAREMRERFLRRTYRPRLGRLCRLVSSKIVRVVCKIAVNIIFEPILCASALKHRALLQRRPGGTETSTEHCYENRRLRLGRLCGLVSSEIA